MFVNFENKANEEESESKSKGISLSSSPYGVSKITGAVHFGKEISHNTHLNEAYIRGAVDFMHSKVENKGCLVEEITNKGASYRYTPMGEAHRSRNFAIGLSGIDLTSAEGFAYSLGRSITAAAASAGVGIAASEAGMGGFVSSIAASLAGAAVNQTIQDRQGPGLGSNGTVSYGRDGKEFKATDVEFDQAEFGRVIEGVKAKVFGQALDEEMSVPEAVEAVEREVAQFVEEVKVEQAKVEETAEKINENEVNLRKEITESIGVESVQRFIEEGSLSEENRQYVIQILSKAIMTLTKQKNELNFKSSTPKNESQKASLQARNELIDEKMQQYSQLNNFLICADQPKIVRSNSLDNLLEDTFIRRSQRALGNVTSVLGGVINEANSNSRDDYLELQLSRLPKEGHNNPELLAQIEMGRMLFKGVTKVGEGISALDDATGNIVSGALRKIDEGAEWLGTHTRRFVRDNLGLGQRIGQNTGDIVKIISGIFVPGTALKALEQTKVIGVAKFKSVLGEKFGLYKGDVSAAKIGLDWTSVKSRGLPAFKHVEIEHARFNPQKVKNGVFFGNPEEKINLAWEKAQKLGIEPISIADYKGIVFDHYIVPFENAGYEYSGGMAQRKLQVLFPPTTCDYITVVTEAGTNKLKTAYPSSRGPKLKERI